MRALSDNIGSQIHRFSRAFLCTVIALFTLSVSSATGAHVRRADPSCRSGASSVRAHVVDGHIVVSEPAVSGCIRR